MKDRIIDRMFYFRRRLKESHYLDGILVPFISRGLRVEHFTFTPRY